MKIGAIIKESRKAQSLTQVELANGICTQATVSNLESLSTIPTVKTLLSIIDRLGLDISELSEYFPANNTVCDILQQAKKLVQQFKYSEAKELLLGKIERKKLVVNELKEYYYYLGMAILMGDKHFSDAIYHFHLGLQESSSNSVGIIDPLLTNSVAKAYFMGNEVQKSRIYFERSLAQLEEVRDIDNQFLELAECVKIYRSTANYYSFVEEYDKSIELYSKGIQLCENQLDIIELEELYYEKGFDLGKTRNFKEAKKAFFIALGLCELKQNHKLIQKILKNSKELDIGLISYDFVAVHLH